MSNVEFVGGHATEQTTEMDPGSYENENKEAAKEAVKKALAKVEKKAKEPDEKEPAEEKSEKQEPAAKAKPKKEPEEEDESEEEKPAPKPKKTEDSDPDALKLKDVLSRKESTAQAKKKDSEERAKWQQEKEAWDRQIQEERYALQREYQKLQKLKENPVEAVRENGWDPEEFITSLAMEGTPEGKQQAMLRKMQQQIAEQQSWREEQLKQQEAYLRHQQETQARQHRHGVEGQFLNLAMKNPLTAQFYKGREAALIAEGDMVAMQYRKLTGGKEASLPEIAEYLEQTLDERAKAWYDSVSKSKRASEEEADDEEDSHQEKEPQQKKQPEGVKKAGKTLNPDATGERRALSKRLDDLDEDERREVAKQEVRKALSKHRKPSEEE